MFTSPRRCLMAAAAAMASAVLALTATAASASTGARAAARTSTGHFQIVSTSATSPAASLVATGLPGPKTFTYTGAEQSYRVPAVVVLLRVDTTGAFGGPNINTGGQGLTLVTYLPVRPRQVLYVEVGQVGTAGGAAGFGGGGAAGTQASGQPGAGSGGGATDVRTCSELAASCPGGITSAKSRLIVAGGGGGNGGTGTSFAGVCGMSAIPGAAGAGGGGTITSVKGGTVILASAGGSVAPSTPAGGGAAKTPGGGAIGANCTTGTGNTYPNSVPGAAGSGGSGASGQQTCNSGGCFADNNGSGGGGASSFVTAKAVLRSFGDARLAPSVTFTPQIAITTPANHATYQRNAVVDAAWTCGGDLTGCTGTVPNGQPIDTATTGTHSFTVQGSAAGTAVAGTVTYTVG